MRCDSRRRAERLVGLALALLLLAVPAALAGKPAPPAFKIYLEETGVYRVTYEELRRAGLSGDVDSRDLALTRGGEEVPIRVADGGDGRFGAGDQIELVGERLPGDRSFYNEHTRRNVYRLAVVRVPAWKRSRERASRRRMSSPAPPAAGEPAPRPAPLAIEEHLEEDILLERFIGRGVEAPEHWFMARLTHADPEPYRKLLRLERLRTGSGRPVSLAVELHGLSTAGRRLHLPDHRVEVTLNGELVGAGEWDGQEAHVIEVAEVPADLVRSGRNVLELKVPPRRPETATPDAESAPIIDAVVLNWIEVRYPRGSRLGSLAGLAGSERIVLDGPAGDRTPLKVRLTTAPGERLVVYGASGSRFDEGNMEIQDRAGSSFHTFYPRAEESVLYAVPEGMLRSPVDLELDRPSGLRDTSRQADYLVVAHPRLLPAIEPLAAFHRRRGLSVAVVEVDDVYDEFNYSVLHPRAVRDFVSYAYHRWQRPAPRFVLLVGDASWKAEATEDETPDGGVAWRNLVPTGLYESFRGRAASDNFFVSVAGDDHLPDLAVGRFPVTEPEEVAAIVDKTLAYAANPPVGPWRRDVLWLSSADRRLQQRSDAVVDDAAARGFAGLKIYPSMDAPSNEQTQEDLLQVLDRGQLLVHFLGHGGRFIWRTGNPDFDTRLDLFTLDHLDRLAPNDRLPLVLSMTCFSAPFDHPSRDSIGEKFLRLPGRGAVAVIGASWKTSPVARFSQLLIEELTSAGTIGEALQGAKRRMKTRSLVEIYNLLGDPALELAVPRLAVEITPQGGAEEGWRIDATVGDEGFAGRALVDWLDGAGEVVASEELAVRGAEFSARLPAAADAVETVRVYVWSAEAGVDGMGAAWLDPATAPRPSDRGRLMARSGDRG